MDPTTFSHSLSQNKRGEELSVFLCSLSLSHPHQTYLQGMPFVLIHKSPLSFLPHLFYLRLHSPHSSSSPTLENTDRELPSNKERLGVKSLRETKMSKEVSEEGHQVHHHGKDYTDPPPAPLLDMGELKLWSFYRALIAEFIATLLFLYVTVATVIGHKKADGPCGGVGLLGIAWSFGGMIFILVYCTAGISGGHINPAVTFGLFLARKVSLIRAVAYMIAQCLGAICGVGLVKAFMKHDFNALGGGTNSVAHGYTKGTALGAEIIGTFVLVYTVFSATDPKRSARDSHVPVLAPLPIGFAVFMVHLATIPITGTGINPARSFGAAVIFNNEKVWDAHWIFWVGPFVGALAAAAYHQYILRAAAIKALGSFRSNPSN